MIWYRCNSIIWVCCAFRSPRLWQFSHPHWLLLKLTFDLPVGSADYRSRFPPTCSRRYLHILVALSNVFQFPAVSLVRTLDIRSLPISFCLPAAVLWSCYCSGGVHVRCTQPFVALHVGLGHLFPHSSCSGDCKLSNKPSPSTSFTPYSLSF